MSNEERNEVRTYFKLIEISRWLGITPFEILMNLVSINHKSLTIYMSLHLYSFTGFNSIVLHSPNSYDRWEPNAFRDSTNTK